MPKLTYLSRSAAAFITRRRTACPNCGSAESTVVDTKYVITKLRRCKQCALLFRTPTDDPVTNPQFYENKYSQGFTTDTPSDNKLGELIKSNFLGTGKDYSFYIDILKSLGVAPGARLFDFGCSWGYGSYQLSKAGYDVTAYEVAPSRRNFAAHKLGVQLVLDMNAAISDPMHRNTYDCFFSAHVLEHVPTPSKAIADGLALLKPGGTFISFTPNGSIACRQSLPNWSKLWGEVHPNFIDDEFLDRTFHDYPRAFASSPIPHKVTSFHMDEFHLPKDIIRQDIGAINQYELIFAARKVHAKDNYD